MTELPITILLWLVVIAGSILVASVMVVGVLLACGVMAEMWKTLTKRRAR